MGGYDGKDGQRELDLLVLWYDGRICNGGGAERNGQNCLVGLRNFTFGNSGMEPILLIFDAHRPADTCTCKRTCYRRRRYLLPSHFQNKPPIMPPKRVKRVMTMPINVIFGHLQVRTAHK